MIQNNIFPNDNTETQENDNGKIEVIAKTNGDLQDIAKELNAEIEILIQSYAIITIEKSKLPLLYTYPQIEHIEIPKNLYFEGASNLVSTCIRSVQDKNKYNLSGKGVIVAIIDSGIDYMHKDFQNPDSTSRILYIWDQTIEGNPPEGFYSGTEYNNQEINQAINSTNPIQVLPSIDYIGHGTAVAGIAVGNGAESGGVNTGVAPEADIIIVKVGTKGYESFAQTTEFMRALKYVIEKAIKLNKPISINMSYGTNNGSHYGDSLFETYITDISSYWKSSIVIPTGNEGSAGHHFRGIALSNSIQEIEYFTAPGIESYYICLWKNFVDSFSVEIIFPNGVSSGIISTENQYKTIQQEDFVLNVLYGQPNHYSYNQEIFFNFKATKTSIKPGVWKLRIISGIIVDGNYDMWLPTIEEVTDKTFFSTPSIYNTLTIPSTAYKTICVSGYNDRISNITNFSGRGNSNLALPNPDVAAPADDVITTKAGGGYDSFSGTSIAAPFVTGSAALMMQWGILNKNDPFLYGERIKAFIRLGAERKKGTIYPNSSYGYGTLCLDKTFEYLTKYQLGGEILWLR